MRIVEMSAAEWEKYAPDAHRAVFAEMLPPGFDRIDFAVLAVDGNDHTVGYVTAREFDKESVYLKRGGCFDPVAKCLRPLVYKTLLDHIDKRYLRITTLVENKNVPYLKLAMSAGFHAIGIRNFKGSIFLELLREKGA